MTFHVHYMDFNSLSLRISILNWAVTFNYILFLQDQISKDSTQFYTFF